MVLPTHSLRSLKTDTWVKVFLAPAPLPATIGEPWVLGLLSQGLSFHHPGRFFSSAPAWMRRVRCLQCPKDHSAYSVSINHHQHRLVLISAESDPWTNICSEKCAWGYMYMHTHVCVCVLVGAHKGLQRGEKLTLRHVNIFLFQMVPKDTGKSVSLPPLPDPLFKGNRYHSWF